MCNAPRPHAGLVAPEDYAAWLRPREVPLSQLKPYPAEAMTGWRVSDMVRDPRAENSPRLIGPVGAPHRIGEAAWAAA